MRFHAKRVNKFLSITLVLTLFFMSLHVVTAAGSANDEDTISTPEYIMDCYDGVGFADRPGGISDLQSTLDAVTLLMETEEKWPYGLWHMIESVVTRYKNMQSPYLNGFVQGNVSRDHPDFRTTALILETLKALGRLDAVDLERVRRYLKASFHESLTMDLWLTEGDFDQKYWALRTAAAINNVEILGIKKIDLGRIIGPDANRADFPEDETYLRWGEEHFEGSIYGGFSEEPEDKQFKIIDSFSMMLKEKDYARTIAPLLVDSEAFVDDILEGLAQESAIIENSNGEKNLRRTARVYDILNKTGLLDKPFSDGTGAYRAVHTHDYLTQAKANLRGGFSDRTTSLSDLLYIQILQEVLDRAINSRAAVFSPVFSDSNGAILASGDEASETLTTGIEEWSVDYDDIVYVPEILLENQTSKDNNPSPLPFLILMCSLIGSVIASGVLGERNLTIFLSICLIILFVVQTGFSVDQVLRDVSAFVSESFSKAQQTQLEDSLGNSMLSIGTQWLDLDYSGPSEPNEDHQLEEDTPETMPKQMTPATVKALDSIEVEVDIRLEIYPNLIRLAKKLSNLFIQTDDGRYDPNMVWDMINTKIKETESSTITFGEGNDMVSMSGEAVRDFLSFVEGYEEVRIRDILAVLERVANIELQGEEPVLIRNLAHDMSKNTARNLDGLLMLLEAIEDGIGSLGDSGVTVEIIYNENAMKEINAMVKKIHGVFPLDNKQRKDIRELGFRIHARMEAADLCGDKTNLLIRIEREEGSYQIIRDSWGMEILRQCLPQGDSIANTLLQNYGNNIYEILGEQIPFHLQLGDTTYTYAWMYSAAAMLKDIEQDPRVDYSARLSFGNLELPDIIRDALDIVIDDIASDEVRRNWESPFLQGG
ncbi:MAG: hypothetical protein R6V83_06665 [Candidatus Thorarchaeota archaeon]